MPVIFKNDDMLVVRQDEVSYEEDNKIVNEFSGDCIPNQPSKLFFYPAIGELIRWFVLNKNGESGDVRQTIQLYHEARSIDRDLRYVVRCRETTYAFSGHTLEPCDISDIKTIEDKVEELVDELFEVLSKKKLKVIYSHSQTYLLDGSYAKSIGCGDAYKLLKKRKCITSTGTLKATRDDVLFMASQLMDSERVSRLITLIEDLS